MKKLYNFILLSLVCFGANAQIVNIDQNGGTSGNIVIGQSNYHVSESIYLASEIGSAVFSGAGNGITKIGFSVNAGTIASLPVTITNFKVSMKNISSATTTLANGANNTTGYTLVYNGSITFSGLGWNTIVLTTPFVRTSGSNLQVKIERANNQANSGLVFDPSVGNYTNTNANSTRRYNSTAAITAATQMVASNFRPAIQLIKPFPVDAEVIGFLNPYSSCYNSPQTVQVGIINNGTTTIAAGAASVSLEVATANTFLGSVTNSAPIPSDSIAILTFTGINMPNVGTNDELAIVSVAGDAFAANDSGFSGVTTTPILSPLPQVEDVEGAFNVFAYLKSIAGSQAWTVLSFISGTGAWQNGYTLNDSLVPRTGGGGSDFFLFDSWNQPAGTVSRLYSNCVSLPASGISRVSFWMSHDSAFATSLDSLYVIVSNDKGATWTRVGGFQRPDDALLEYTWLKDSVDISAYNGQTIQLGFEGVSDYGNAIGLDDINIYNIVTCTTFVTPTFNQVAAVCAGSPISLPAVSTNSITGTWTPAINNQATTTYTFVPNAGQCATTTPVVTMTVTVNPRTLPTFTQVGAICKDGSFSLPTTSNNSITGTWSPAINNQATTTYTFTPTAGLCASTATMTVTVKQPTTSNTSISNCVSYTWNANTYTSSGTYTKTGLTNIAGCDSTAFLNLTIKQATSSNTSNSVCVNQLPYTWNGLSLSASGTYTKTGFTNVAGCDSIAILDLTVNSTPVTPTFNQVAAICLGGSFTLPTTSINSVSGTWSPAVNNQATTTYTFTPSGSQCATTTTMTVDVNQPTTPTFTQVAAICAGGSFTLPTTSNNSFSGTWSPAVNNQTTTTYTFTPAAGVCATTASMTVTVKQTSSSNSSANVCQTSLPYNWNGVDYTASGTYSKVFAGANAIGCDSTAILNLVVNTNPVTPSFTQVAAICADGSFSLPTTSNNAVSGSWSPAINNQTTTTYTFTPNAGQCVTLTPVTMTVTVNPVNNTATSITECNSYSWNSITYTTSGTYTRNSGCSTDTLYLTIKRSSSSTSSANVCQTSLPYNWNGVDYNASGTYTKVFAGGNAVGCDSSAILNLAVNTNPVTPSFTQVAAICVGGSFTLPTTSTNSVSGTWSPAINNQSTTTYTFTPNAGQCVSNTAVTMTVDVNQIVTPSFTQVSAICAGGSFTLPTTSTNSVSGTWSPAINNQVTTTYTFTPTAGLCATTTTMTVDVTPNIVPTFDQVAAICAGGTINLPTTSNNSVNGTWSPAVNNQSTTTYTFTPSAGICATPATMIVTVNQPTTPTFTQVPAICAGGSFTLPTTSNNGFTGTWSPTTVNNQATTTYTFTPDAGQCAAQATMSVTVNKATKDSVTACSSYTWNGKNYTVSGVYDYENNCNTLDTLYLTINVCGDAVVYPNPTDGNEYVTINYANANFQADSKVVISVYDRNGRLVSKSPVKVVPASRIDNKVNLGLKACSNGMYFIKIETTIGQSARYSTKIFKASKN